MEPRSQVMQTPRGELIISGPLRNLPDLSFQDLNRNAFVKFEEGQSLIEFSKPSQDVIKREFDVNHIQLLNQIFEQDKYAALFGNNVRKTLSLNRYNDVLVYQRNAVTLPEFINASWVAGPYFPEQRSQYIATQGPLPTTIETFWKMVWVNQVGSIFMLCSPQECEIKKCEFYWPVRQSTLEAGGFQIRITQETRKSGHIIRIFEVTFSGETRRVSHFHYISWPDHGVPQESATLESLLEDLHGSEGPTPVVIHCSAGVGRTGTFIALSHLKHLIFAQKRGNVDHGLSVFSVVRRLREQRVLMVQSKEQYELLYDFACMWIRRT